MIKTIQDEKLNCLLWSLFQFLKKSSDLTTTANMMLVHSKALVNMVVVHIMTAIEALHFHRTVVDKYIEGAGNLAPHCHLSTTI